MNTHKREPKQATIETWVKRSLTKDGYSVLTAANGEHGSVLAIEQRPCVITLGLMMPEMDGFGFMQELRTRPAAAVFLSS